MKIINIFFIVLFASSCFAQSDLELLRKGNKLYDSKKYKDSEINYRKGIEKNKDNYKGIFNLGDALYKQGNYEEAAKAFADIANKNIDKSTNAKAYHNLGNSLLQAKKYDESILAYKNALRNVSDDKDTKYNLEYAKKKLIQQQQQKQQQNKDNKDKKDDKKDKQQQQQQQQEKQQKEDKQQQQQQKNQISKQDAERMLEALNNQEKDVQDKLKKQKVLGARSKVEKDW